MSIAHTHNKRPESEGTNLDATGRGPESLVKDNDANNLLVKILDELKTINMHLCKVTDEVIS